ncbi:hypothetical protein GLW08_03400 [Pontibacillus yanchengensis]|uniref:Uncharacterized protein n=2 Tax=Pontibacillus yanchengensis TaxID=462910 RepID=A0ACC7VCQ2_9BACI|nr:hypothetical protein [Pontibacillus yanchengensis]MYL35351.1 hypothetical protein [Pontibacillus yanchengensis]MYL52380.1 hypothetical protein [Pontibacillus yanchengensis]
MKQLLLTSMLLMLLVAGCSNDSNENSNTSDNKQNKTTQSEQDQQSNESNDQDSQEESAKTQDTDDENTYAFSNKNEELTIVEKNLHEFKFEYMVEDVKNLNVKQEQISIKTPEAMDDYMEEKEITSVSHNNENLIVKGYITFDAEDLNKLEVIDNLEPFIDGLRVEQADRTLNFNRQ